MLTFNADDTEQHLLAQQRSTGQLSKIKDCIKDKTSNLETTFIDLIPYKTEIFYIET